MKQKVRYSEVINYAGAFIALLIGSGFATGQELLQFFSSYGKAGLIGVVVCFILLCFVGVEFVKYGNKHKLENPNDIYKIICGKNLGTFYDYFSIFFIFLSFTVMVSGAQATAVQHYNAPKYVGGLILGIIAIITVVFGLEKIVQIIGKIGPVIVIMAIVVGLISISRNYSNFDSAISTIDTLNKNGEITQASSFGFFMSSLSYVGFCMLWLAAFCASIGRDTENIEEAKQGQIVGSLGFSLATFIMTLAIILSIKEVYQSQIPSLILANQINPILANIFSAFIILGIYTTSVPLLWTVIVRFYKEGAKEFKIATIVIGSIGMVIGLLLKFDVLVNYVYAINGYLGILLIIIMIYKAISKKNE
ncbi:hypothetical protein [uncultured Anaerococcus sp.]|uniref:YkvI family membrane protein n=1 Tax=uncultured Anaerococcus sp. TaxID=293428 RepID=UPI002630006D|nr:hypothetical protein [uncultured Anaerococcus sp.]